MKVKNDCVVFHSSERIEFVVDKTNNKTIMASFSNIAENLMFDYIIMVNDQFSYRLVEAEFYLYCSVHKDPYPHNENRQLEMGQWYFHDSGIDITFGSNGDYGGILIRSIQRVSGGKYFNGPWVVRRELLSYLTKAANGKLSLKVIPDSKNELDPTATISKSVRIGINPVKDKTEDKKYYTATYRFVLDANNPKNRLRKENLIPL